MKNMFSDLPKSIKIQMYATYIGLFLILGGMMASESLKLPWIFPVCLIGAIVAIAISYIYPFLEETAIIREVNQYKIAILTTITETEQLPMHLELRIQHYVELEDWIDEMEEKEERYKEELPAGSEELLDFIELPIKAAAKKYLQEIKGKVDENTKIYMLSLVPTENFGIEFEYVILTTKIPLNEMNTYPSAIEIDGYDIECRAIRGNAKLLQIIDDLPILEISHLWDDDFRKQKELEAKRTESELERIKDKIIQTLLSWRYRDIARLRKSEAEVKMYKENFELILQDLENLKLNVRYEKQPTPWYLTAGWLVAILVLILALSGVI